MPPAPHRVRRQRVRVSVRTQREAFEVRSRLRGPLQDELSAAFDRALSEAAPVGELLHLPLLAVSVRVASIDELPERLRVEASARLAELLRDRVAARPAGAGHVPLPASPGAQTSRAEALLQYAATGSLPWAAREVDAASTAGALRPEVADLIELGRAAPAPATGAARIAFWFRVLQLLADGAWTGAVGRILPADLDGPERQSILAAIDALSTSGPQALSRHARLRFAATGAAVAERAVAPSSTEAIAALRAGEIAAGAPSVTEIAGRLPDAARTLLQRWSDAAATPSRPITTPATIATLASGPAPVRAPRAPPAGPRPAAPDAFPLVAPFAGLVLLHPFLPRFLQALGVTCEATAPLPTESLPRAAAALHFLATGADEPWEFDAAWIKLLLGLHPTDPLPTASGLVDDATAREADTLLGSVIGHWRALGSTSATGLRDSFLGRRGLLYDEPDGWRLRVEPGPFDVLLDRLPWAISLFRHRWMRKAVVTEWPRP